MMRMATSIVAQPIVTKENLSDRCTMEHQVGTVGTCYVLVELIDVHGTKARTKTKWKHK